MGIYHKKLYIKDTKGVVQNVPIYTTKEECNNLCVTLKDGGNTVYVPYSGSKSNFSLYLKKQGRTYNLGVKQDTEYRMSKLYPSTYQTMTSVDNIKDDLQRRIDSNVSLLSMFETCYKLINVPLFNTQNIIDMRRMFLYCNNLIEVPLFDTQNVTNMQAMLNNCQKLKTVPLFNTQNVVDMSAMFTFDVSLTEVPLFDTRNVTNMSHMFWGCKSLTNVPSFNTQKVEDMNSMFSECSSLTSIPIFDIRNVYDVNNMFGNTKVYNVTFKNKPANLQVTSKILCGDPYRISVNFI